MLPIHFIISTLPLRCIDNQVITLAIIFKTIGHLLLGYRFGFIDSGA
jgi:hypothetical protein